MEVDIDRIKEILEGRYFSATVFRDEEKTGVSVEYGPRLKMRINGLRPDFPSYLLFEKERIFYSEDGNDWKEVKKNLGFQIFRLLDPRLLLEQVSVTSARWEVGLNEFEGEYALQKLKLGLPDEVMGWIKERREDMRKVRFLLRANGLVDSMIQRDLPPNLEMITLKFKYPAL